MFSSDGHRREQLISLSPSILTVVSVFQNGMFQKKYWYWHWQLVVDKQICILIHVLHCYLQCVLPPSHMSIHISLLLSLCSFVLNGTVGVVCACLQMAGLSDLSPLERGFIVLLAQLLFGSYRLPARSRSFRQHCPLRQEVNQQPCWQKESYCSASSQMRSTFLPLYRIPGRGL